MRRQPVLGVVMLVDYDNYDNDHYDNNYNNNDVGLSHLCACLPTEHQKNDKVMFNGVRR